MKPKILLWLGIALCAASLTGVLRSADFSDWITRQEMDHNGGDDGIAVLQPNYHANQTYATKLKTPWTDTKIVLYRATGEKVGLDAKGATYTVWTTRNGTNRGKGIDYSMGAFIDPATRLAWVGHAGRGDVYSLDFSRFDSPSSIVYLTNTNSYIQTASAIVSGEATMLGGAFAWSGSLINQAQPGEKLEELINHCEKSDGGLWPFGQRVWENSFRNYFRDEFFSSDSLGAADIPIQSISVAHGKLRLNFDSEEYRTCGSVWLDLETFNLARAIEWRPVHFNLKTFCWGFLPALLAIVIARETFLLARKARSVAHCALSGLVLIGVIWSLLLLYRIHILGAWPAYLPLMRPVFALGDAAIYYPVLVIGVVAMITAAQASALRIDKLNN
jgi:hypothetical protein